MLYFSYPLATSKLHHYSPYFFPNHFDKGGNDTSPLLPKNHAHIFSLPFSNKNKVLRVYFNPFVPIKEYFSSYNNEPIIELIKTGIWGEQFDASEYKVYLFVYSPQENSSTYLGLINPELQTGISGALYVPFAIRGDNKAIILQAWMGSPGAGAASLIMVMR